MLSVVKEKEYIINPNLMIIQSKLYSPSYAGPGKWVIYNPLTKQALLAVGKDRLPDIVPLLTDNSKNTLTLKDIKERNIETLIEKGIFIEFDGFIENFKSSTFVEKYHNAVFDFPFRDYNDNEWLQKDHETMDHYAKLWEHPPVFTKRNGLAYEMPETSLESLKIDEKKISEKFISVLLKSVFGPIKIKGKSPNIMVQKLSPSGGGKHPIEGVVFLNKAVGTLDKGVYTYDQENHKLVLNDEYVLESENSDDDTFKILIRARVDRPMWRYREIRSFRAVLLDAGHLIENIRQICEFNGFYTKITPSITTKNHTSEFEWMKEPEICSLTISMKNHEKTTHDSAKELKGFQQEGRYLTNPSIYFTFEDGKLICNSLWPKIVANEISYKDFEILTHCLPSRRGDRDITDKGIFKEFLVKKNNIDILTDLNFLLPEKVAKSMYKEVFQWSSHNWYLNFLVHCEVINSKNKKISSYRLDPIISNIEKNFERRTTRNFINHPIPTDQLNRIINEAIPKDDQTTELIINVKNSEGIIPGLYSWKNNSLTRLGEHISPEQVRELIIGQEWAGTGSVDVWIKSCIDTSDPSNYEMEFIKLGSVAQRICISCTEDNIGTFMTPAIKDKEVLNTLNLPNVKNIILYHMTIGYRG
ncbi:nitroreductase family protein [Jeotgalibacillus terrae]|uniref:Nitroreductase family protein n=1 Tax=Jeotgalibacillus terrae TaxID=587735 RepID=A0ABW5ZK57_9BACL|nr:nitroreductase family protein [Jeotgalibacillus terrae]MBM7580833.1 SagB-type dehydrogenase family enzyme [Jeotgalibacillus terrae]